MTRTQLQNWLDAYVDAWRTYDPARIGALFSTGAEYHFNPFGTEPPLRGREAIVTNWLSERDDPASWEAHYEPVAVDGDVGVARGRTRYTQGGVLLREFANIFVMEFDGEARCTRFTEHFMERR